jgi:hypothetical protein
VASQSAKSDIMNEAKSVSKWAASVAIARLLAKTPPGPIDEHQKASIVHFDRKPFLVIDTQK